MALAINPAADMAQLRNQQALGMSAADGGAAAAGAASPVAGTMPATAAAAPAAVAPNGQVAAVAAGAAAPGAAGDASMAAAAVQPPPSTGKIVIQSLLKGAMTGVSVTLGLKSFGPMLAKVGFLKNIIGAMPVAAAGGAAGVAGKGLLGFLSRIPIIGKILPMTAKAGIQGFLITAAIGAAVGGIFGAISGLGKAKKAQAEYADALAKAQAAAVQQPPPVVTPPAEAEAPAPPKKAKAAPVKPRFKSWVVARSGSHMGTQKFGSYVAKGESLATLAKRFHTTPAEIKKLNPSITGDDVPTGTKLKLARKVVPNAQAWKG